MSDIKNIKVVDAEALDAALNDLAESIRTKSGVKGDLAFPDPNEFKSAVDIIDTVKNETKPETIKTNGNHPTDSYSHVDVEVEFKTQSKTATPSQAIQTVEPDIGYDGLSSVMVDKIPSNYIDTSGATAGVYDIYYNKTAFVNGSLVTGAYRMVGRNGGFQVNSGSTGCSSSRLVISCPFQPTHVCIILNAGTHTTNTVIAAFFGSDSATYHSRTSSGVTRNQYTSSISNYWSYDATKEQVIVNRPNTTYSWSAQNYRYFCFK